MEEPFPCEFFLCWWKKVLHIAHLQYFQWAISYWEQLKKNAFRFPGTSCSLKSSCLYFAVTNNTLTMCPKYMTTDYFNLKIHTGSKEMVISFNLKCYLLFYFLNWYLNYWFMMPKGKLFWARLNLKFLEF